MKSLICITTCNRSNYLKRFLPTYHNYCIQNESFDFVVSVDGKDERTINYLKEHEINFIYSEEREGVGISKNRVLKELPGYDYYFFVEDDVELIDPDIFNGYINLSRKYAYHHLSCGKVDRFHTNRRFMRFEDDEFLYSDFGNGIFNFFSKEGIAKVGGFHTTFAKYRRYGHTEHSHRFKKQNLNPAPFILPLKYSAGYIRFRHPESVTANQPEWINPNTGYCIEEEALIKSNLSFYPIKTLSKYHYVAFGKQNEIHCSQEFIDAFNINDYEYLQKEFDKSERKIIELEKKINYILNSNTYKVGRIFTRLAKLKFKK